MKMKSIFGRVDNKNLLNELLEKGLDSLSANSQIERDSKLFENSGFGQITFYPNHSKIYIHKNQLLILSDSRIDNKDELKEELEIEQESLSDDEVLIRAFEKWEYECTKHLIGDFAFVIWNVETKELFCARDHFGVKPFYYFFNGESFVFSSEISAILSQKDLNFTIDQQYIADTLSIVKLENHRTTFSEIKKLPPAHFLILKNNQLEVREYWKLSIQKELQLDERQIIEQFRKLLIVAVECRVTKNAKTGAELSGGLDSSSITAVASKFTNLCTFSHVLPDQLLGVIFPFKDERDFINQLTDYCHVKESFFITSEESGIVDAINQNLYDFGYVSQQNFATFSDQLYKTAAENGIDVLLSGFSGDEVITSKSGDYLLELATNNLWREIINDLKNQQLSKINVFGRIIYLYLKAKVPFIYHVLSKLINPRSWWKSKFENLAFNKQFAAKMKIKNRYFEYYARKKTSLLQEHNIERITHPHVSQRLEYSATAAKKYGIEYRYPFLDKRLIEFYLSMPPRLKARNGIVRYAIRETMKEILPESIRLRNDKSGTTIPTVFMRMVNDKNKIIEIISRSKGNEKITYYIDFEKYSKWFNLMLRRSVEQRKDINPGTFYNYLKLMLFIEQNPSLFE